jgi:hypothetical protein
MRYVLLVMCGLLAAQRISAQPVTDEKPMNGLVSSAIAAPSADEAAKRFAELFASRTREELKGLKQSDHAGLALAATWQLLYREQGEAVEQLDKNEPQKIRQDSASYFLGFLDARTNAESPDWWRRSALGATITHRRYAGFPRPENWVFHETPIGPRSATPVKRSEQSLVFSAGGKEFQIRHDVLERHLTRIGLKESAAYIAFAPGKEHYYFAAYSEAGFPFRMACFGAVDHAYKWTADVWAANRHALEGKSFHMVEIRESERAVLVYGLEPSALYVEGFDIKTGKALFRFSTNNWRIPGEK